MEQIHGDTTSMYIHTALCSHNDQQLNPCLLMRSQAQSGSCAQGYVLLSCAELGAAAHVKPSSNSYTQDAQPHSKPLSNYNNGTTAQVSEWPDLGAAPPNVLCLFPWWQPLCLLMLWLRCGSYDVKIKDAAQCL